jgi:ferredoxin-NADP reductase
MLQGEKEAGRGAWPKGKLMESATYRTAFRMKAACEQVTGFRFDKPEGYTFEPGQYFSLTIPTPDGEQSHIFSHASAPADPFIEMATRMTGSVYKDALGQLVRGDTVQIAGPNGRFGVPEGAERLCFLCGGVGVSPARSIVRHVEQRRLGYRMRLFYGVHDQGCIPYAGEFAEYERRDRRFRLVQILEEPLPGWAGERGFITADLVRRNMESLEGWHFFVTGPPAMIQAMSAVLDELGIPAGSISTEGFTGYAPR